MAPDDARPIADPISAERAARLERNMMALDSGLNQLARRHEQRVTLWYEDPEAFGAGHFVLYPIGHSLARFSVEEQYTGSDWADPDRLPTSWTWHAERLRRDPNGAWHWTTSARGSVESDDFAQLLVQAHAWVRRIETSPDNAVPVLQTGAARHPSHGPQF